MNEHGMLRVGFTGGETLVRKVLMKLLKKVTIMI